MSWSLNFLFKRGAFHLALHFNEGCSVGTDRKVTLLPFFALHRKTLYVPRRSTAERRNVQAQQMRSVGVI
jgi:hypothetical protein